MQANLVPFLDNDLAEVSYSRYGLMYMCQGEERKNETDENMTLASNEYLAMEDCKILGNLKLLLLGRDIVDQSESVFL